MPFASSSTRPGFATILLADNDTSRRKGRGRRARAFGARGRVRAGRGDPARRRGHRAACSRRASTTRSSPPRSSAGVPVASSDDEHDALEQLRALDPNARSSGVTVAIGCGLAPGLTDVLAVHAAALFESVDEIRVGAHGLGRAGECRHRSARAAESRCAAWRDGGWREERSRGDALVFFPDPIGGRDCRVVTGSTLLLVDAFPNVPRLSVQLGEPPRRTRFRRRFGDEGEWGAARVEVWGQRDGSHGCVAYGVVDRTAVAAGTVLAVVTARLAGVIGPVVKQPGVQGLGVLVEPVPFLAELAQRGVRSAVFEGVPVA